MSVLLTVAQRKLLNFKWNLWNASAPLFGDVHLPPLVVPVWSEGEGPPMRSCLCPRVRVPACCTGQSFPSWRAEYSLSCWGAALPGQDSNHLAHSMTSRGVKLGLDHCVSLPRSLLTFTIIQCFFSTFFQGKGQTPCQTASCILFTLDICTHFPVLTVAKTRPHCKEWAVGGHSLPYFPISSGCSSFCFSGSGSSLDFCVGMLNPVIWQKLYLRSSGTCHLTVFCHRQAMRVETGRWDFNLV